MSTITPVLRIFDYDKAIEFYVNWPGFRHRLNLSSLFYLIAIFDKPRNILWKQKGSIQVFTSLLR
ncbi:MAG: hypothetical protein JWR54_2290 [Mucilaginibacter sp.]|jgi:uncharacterized membrane protein|nr:hypothetical protein [Mucilaginibacter sp.]